MEQLTGTAGVRRHASGEVLMALSSTIRVTNSNEAEVVAMKQALQFF